MATKVYKTGKGSLGDTRVSVTATPNPSRKERQADRKTMEASLRELRRQTDVGERLNRYEAAARRYEGHGGTIGKEAETLLQLVRITRDRIEAGDTEQAARFGMDTAERFARLLIRLEKAKGNGTKREQARRAGERYKHKHPQASYAETIEAVMKEHPDISRRTVRTAIGGLFPLGERKGGRPRKT